MGFKKCMNEACGATTSSEWKKGWSLRSGGFAILCSHCGSAYAKSVFCDAFHLRESGWRECRACLKHIHCGCVASTNLYEHMDFGGIVCKNCAKCLEVQSAQLAQIPNDGDAHPMAAEDSIKDDKFGESLQQSTNAIKVGTVATVRREEPASDIGESSKGIPNLNLQCLPHVFDQAESSNPKPMIKNSSDRGKAPIQHGYSTGNPFPNQRQSRCRCSVPKVINPANLDCLSVNHDSKKLKISESKATDEEDAPSGLDALATAAVLGNEIGHLVRETTKHPRHRPGCTCIVCVKPPTGKGKQEPTCRCKAPSRSKKKQW